MHDSNDLYFFRYRFLESKLPPFFLCILWCKGFSTLIGSKIHKFFPFISLWFLLDWVGASFFLCIFWYKGFCNVRNRVLKSFTVWFQMFESRFCGLRLKGQNRNETIFTIFSFIRSNAVIISLFTALKRTTKGIKS